MARLNEIPRLLVVEDEEMLLAMERPVQRFDYTEAMRLLKEQS